MRSDMEASESFLFSASPHQYPPPQQQYLSLISHGCFNLHFSLWQREQRRKKATAFLHPSNNIGSTVPTQLRVTSCPHFFYQIQCFDVSQCLRFLESPQKAVHYHFRTLPPVHLASPTKNFAPLMLSMSSTAPLSHYHWDGKKVRLYGVTNTS